MEEIKVQHLCGDLKKPSHLIWDFEHYCPTVTPVLFSPRAGGGGEVILFKVNSLCPEDGKEMNSVNLMSYFLSKVETYLPIFLEFVSSCQSSLNICDL